MEDLISRALHFASDARDGQKRKYTEEPYINHCINVSDIVRTARHWNNEMVAAALLHDTVEDTETTIEDTETTIEDIRANFGDIVAIFVDGLTDISRPEDGNRAVRKRIDREHLAKQLPPVQTIKVADLIDNTSTIVAYDPDFAKVYMNEKKLLLDVLTQADVGLWTTAKWIVQSYYAGEQEGV